MNSELLDNLCDSKQTVGRAVRHPKCPFCGEVISSRGFVVTKTSKGFLMWCHRCHGKRFIRNGTPGVKLALTLAQDVLQPKKHTEQLIKTRDIQLPHDFSPDIPLSGKLWLRTYGITDEEIKRFGFGYSYSLDRLIIPVYDEGRLVFWQGRYLGCAPNSPKYLSVAMQRGSHMFRVNSTERKTIVIVEDVLSAIVVARAGFSTAALLGSYTSPAVLRRLVDSGHKRIVVWLDPDKRKESVQVAKKLQAMGARSWPVILAGKDPKCYRTEQVRSFVNRGRP